MAVKDGDSGAATIDISKVEKGSKDGLPSTIDDVDKMDFGNEVVEETPAKAPAKEKKAAKKPEVKKEEETPAEEEEEEEPDEEEEEETEEEEEEAPPVKVEPKKETKMVPQARLMHVKNQRDNLEAALRAANAEIENFKQTSGNAKKAEQYEELISSKYIALEKLRAEGNVAEAAKLSRELDGIKDEANRRQSAAIANIEARNLLEQRLYDSVVQQLEIVAPQVNPDDDNFDQSLVRDIDSLTRGYEAHGMSPSDALKKAAERLLGKDILTEKSIRREKQPEPKKTDTKKNAEAIKKMPPSSLGDERTEKAQSLKPSLMTRDEFAKLPEATQRRLMGDELE